LPRCRRVGRKYASARARRLSVSLRETRSLMPPPIKCNTACWRAFSGRKASTGHPRLPSWRPAPCVQNLNSRKAADRCFLARAIS
jgi:hypothetical protein